MSVARSAAGAAQLLLRNARQPAVRASRAAALASARNCSSTWRPAPAARLSASAPVCRHRCFSSSSNRQSANDESELRVAGSRKWSYEDILEQVKVNEELEASGEQATADGKPKVVFVDVREPDELRQTGKIPGAINIPVTTAIQSFHVSAEDFFDMYGFDRPSKDTHLLFYCKAGVRARTAAGLAQHAGWENIGDYPGSWLDWAKREGPVEEVKTKR